ncbi:MAG: LysR family transcriptional regulator, partial [Brachymonas sp.]|nr:LysR family transcriptional regulator [Brachymonas sp.]
MNRLEQMRIFVAVVDAGSFVGASDALDISKAAASRRVSELEQRLGVRLLHRTTRKLSLTPEGEIFYARCKDLLAELEDAEGEITSHSREPAGTLRLNVPFSFGLQHLGALWPAFMAQYPRITLDVTLADRVVDLVDEGYDLAVRIGKLQTSSLVSRTLAHSR